MGQSLKVVVWQGISAVMDCQNPALGSSHVFDGGADEWVHRVTPCRPGRAVRRARRRDRRDAARPCCGVGHRRPSGRLARQPGRLVALDRRLGVSRRHRPGRPPRLAHRESHRRARRREVCVDRSVPRGRGRVVEAEGHRDGGARPRSARGLLPARGALARGPHLGRRRPRGHRGDPRRAEAQRPPRRRSRGRAQDGPPRRASGWRRWGRWRTSAW